MSRTILLASVAALALAVPASASRLQYTMPVYPKVVSCPAHNAACAATKPAPVAKAVKLPAAPRAASTRQPSAPKAASVSPAAKTSQGRQSATPRTSHQSSSFSGSARASSGRGSIHFSWKGSAPEDNTELQTAHDWDQPIKISPDNTGSVCIVDHGHATCGEPIVQ